MLATFASLFAVLVRCQGVLSSAPTGREPQLAELLSDNDVATFIGRHESGGYEWFVKERWELLVSWLHFTALAMEAGTARGGTVSAARQKALQKYAATLSERAATAGYRVDRFLRLGIYNPTNR